MVGNLLKIVLSLSWIVINCNALAQQKNDVSSDTIVDDLSKIEDPCNNRIGHLKIHFNKFTTEIIETECDSLIDLVNYIQRDSSTNFYLIGIATNQLDEEKFNAKYRAQIVIDQLIEMGINSDRLTPTVSYFRAPTNNEDRDWPFYPEWYEYEIGVYLEID